MSSTNRSNARNTHVSDYYVTPVKSIRDFMHRFEQDYGPLGSRILDPCAGGDEINPMSYPVALFAHRYTDVTTLDIREDSLAMHKGKDFLKVNVLDFMEQPDCIITNPPFNIALEVIQKSLREVATGGYVVMLLRLNFFGSKSRKPFWEKNLPMCCYVHSERMKFLNTGGTDSIEYMHCVWKKGYGFAHTALRII
jgi:hypothetical protein